MSDLALFAETTFRNQNRKFGIKTDDRRRHMYIIGKTGMGKSTILENMIVEDMRQGRGLAVVDPHGDLAEKILQFVPAERVKDVIYFNPADHDFPIAFNVVEQVEPHMRHLVASGLIGVFQKLWADSWGPRLEYILRNTILAILDYPNSTLLSITRMLSDKSFRKKVIESIQDPVVKSFWVKEFAGYADKFASEAVSPIQNKVGQFLSSSLIRNIVGQVKSSIDIREIMDSGKILIMNLSKGRIGEDNSELLGSMMITKIQLAAMSRVDMHEEERRDFYLYVDEFQNFATESFANILSEARKYRLSLIMGHQYIEQLSDEVKAAVFGNVGTLVVFRVGATDAEELVKEFTPVFTEEDLVGLPKYNMVLKLMIDGVASDPFSARGLGPLTAAQRTGNEEKVIEYTRHAHSNPRKEVEDKIMRWHSEDEGEVRPPVVKAPVPASRAEAYQAPSAPGMPGTSGMPAPAPRAPQATPPFQQYSPQTYVPPVSRPAPAAPNQFPQAGPVAPSQPILDPSIYKYEAVCSRCNKTTRVPFKPDGIRPVFCKECLAILRSENENSLNERKVLKQRELEQFSSATQSPQPYVSQSQPPLQPAQPYQPAAPAMTPPSPQPQYQPQPPVNQVSPMPNAYQQQPVTPPQPQAMNAPLPHQAPAQPMPHAQPIYQPRPSAPYQAPVQRAQPPLQRPAPLRPAPSEATMQRPPAITEKEEQPAPAFTPPASFSPFKPVHEEPAPVLGALSLSDLAQRPPVDFRGRPIKPQPRTITPEAEEGQSEAPSPQAPSQSAGPSSPHGTLNAGQPLKFPSSDL